MSNMNWSAKQAMTALGISEERQLLLINKL
jgi:hypothetical protein